MARATPERLEEIRRERDLKKLLNNKDVKASISALVKEEKYDEVFVNYGKEAYRRFVPRKVRNQEFKKLKQEGRYEDIYQKFGEKAYNSLLAKAMFDEIKDEKGFLRAAFWKIKNVAKETILTAAIFGLATTTVLPPAVGYATSLEINDNRAAHAQEIDAYNKRNAAYAESFGNVKVSKLQMIMKSMDDMWGSIQGFKSPEKNITGFLELDLATEEGYGVCRNMASDVAKRLNALDKSFNARTIPVKMGETGFYEIANIHRTIIQEDQTIIDSERGEADTTKSASEVLEDKILETMQEIAGNHMVTLVDIPEDNIILVIDPTNPGLGIYTEGRILMLNDTESGQPYEYDSKEIASITLTRGISEVGPIAGDFIKSFESPSMSWEELREKYGTDAQNQALGEVRALFIAVQQEKEDSFDERIKFDTAKGTQEAKAEHKTVEQRTNDGEELEQ